MENLKDDNKNLQSRYKKFEIEDEPLLTPMQIANRKIVTAIRYNDIEDNASTRRYLEKTYRSAIDINPKDIKLRQQFIDILKKYNKFEQVLNQYEEIIDLELIDSDNIEEIFDGVAEAKEALGDHEGAQKAIDYIFENLDDITEDEVSRGLFREALDLDITDKL